MRKNTEIRENTEMRRRRERDICDKERENENKIIIYIMQVLSIPCQNCDGTVAYCKSLAHLTHLIKGLFGVWCGKCAKYLAFDTFATAAVDALIFLLPPPTNKIHFSLSFYVTKLL